MPERIATNRLAIREITSPDDPAFAPAHELLRREFTRSEMLPVADWRNTLREREAGLWTDVSWHLLVAERDGRVLAAATGSYLGNVNAGVVGYVAVHPDARRTGLGPRMRRALLRRFETDARRAGRPRLTAIIGEVRADNPWLAHLVRAEGALALDFPYYQPSLGGTREAVPLVLYYQPLGESRRSLSASEVRKLLYTLWRRVYRIGRPMTRPEFRRMLRSLHNRQRVGQQPRFREPRRASRKA